MAHYKKHDLNFLAIGIEFEVANKPENRALLEEFGKDYAEYRRRTPWLIPRLKPISSAPKKLSVSFR